MKINMHTSHPSAFISSTFIDLYEDRNEVANTLKKRGLNVNALDKRPASTQSSRKEILNGIQESDFVVLLIGDRYGSILPKMTGSNVLSITWWEYINAKKMGKPIIAFFKKFDASNPISHDDKSDSSYGEKREFFDKFKNIITQRHNPAFYAEAQELAEKIDNSLISIYRAGVKELSSKKIELSNKVDLLEAELSRLKCKPANSTHMPSESTVVTRGLVDLAVGAQKATNQFGLADLARKK